MYLVCVKYFDDNGNRHIESFLINYDKKITLKTFYDFKEVIADQLAEKISDVNFSISFGILSFSKLEED